MSPDTMLVSMLSEPVLAASNHRSTPARLPVVTEFHASALPAAVSTILRSGLRKFTAAKRPLPHGLASAAAILRPLPQDPNAVAEIAGAERPCGMHHIGAMQHVDALQRRSPDHLGRERHRCAARTDDVAHLCLAHRKLL